MATDNIGGDGYTTHMALFADLADALYYYYYPQQKRKRHINESVVSYIGDNVGLIPK